jgi:hypothetical protein
VEANEDSKDVSNTNEFQVAVVNEELSEVAMRKDGLMHIAQLTGGTCLSVSDLPKLASLVDASPLTTTVRSERPLWDKGIIAIVLIGLMGMEWILRRKHDLT